MAKIVLFYTTLIQLCIDKRVIETWHERESFIRAMAQAAVQGA
jgi:hypothetical protein